LLPHLDKKNSPPWFIIIFPITFPFVIYGARLIACATVDSQLAFRRAFVFVICGFYLSALYSFWTLITRQDFLPYHPLAFVFWSAALIHICKSEKVQALRLPRAFHSQLWPAYLVGLGLFLCVVTRPFWINSAKLETDLLRDVLALTEPGEYVFDCKGETIFRQRCYRPVLEAVTFERIQRKLIADDMPARCVQTRTCLAAPNEQPTWFARQFVTQNYLRVRGLTRVAGGYLRESPSQAGTLEFDSVIPGSYKIINHAGEVNGILDGEIYKGARFLNPGKHFFRPVNEADTLAFVWARAVDLHYSPFDYVPPKPAKNRFF
jgi:hypothetical protein